MNGDTVSEMRKQLYASCLQAGLEIVPIDTAAKVLAVLLEYGNNENFVYNDKFVCEVRYIQKRFGIDGGEVPDAEMVRLLQDYVKKLRVWYSLHKDDPVVKGKPAPYIPDWTHELFSERYNITNLK